MEPTEQPEPPIPLNYAVPGIARTGKMRVAATFASQFELHLAQNYLEEHGIHSFTTGEALMGGVGTYVLALQKMDVMVAEADLQEAKRLLLEIAEKRKARLRDPYAPPCPKCGAEGAKRRLSRGALSAICAVAGTLLSILLQSGIPFAIAFVAAAYLIFSWDRVRWICEKCGHKFSARAIDPEDEDE